MADRSPDTHITEDMVGRAAAAISDLLGMLGIDPDERTEHNDAPPIGVQLAELALQGGLAGCTVVQLPEHLHGATWIEFCRACRDECDEIVPAEFILWGKLLPPEQMGPRCAIHTADYIGTGAMSQIDQWAIFDLRPFNRMLAGSVSLKGDDTNG